MEIINIFWTGGVDSTFRVLQLSRQKVIIQPIYVIDSYRKSQSLELESMRSIIKCLKQKEETVAEIADILMFEKEKIPIDNDITNAYQILSKTIRLGGQYEWLSRLAKLYPGVELGIEKPNGEYSGCCYAIEKYGKLIKYGSSFVVDKQNSSKEIILLFQNFTFPIYYITEIDMVSWVKKYGYEDVMSLIWFCHAPINNTPCGVCRPCQQKMECGMSFLLPRKAQNRYKTYSKLKEKCRICSKLYYIIIHLFS